MSGYEEYKHVTARYRAQYGGKVLVLMEVGAFYEMYGCSESEVDIEAVCELLNIQLTRKDKETPAFCSNPHMAGLPKVSIEKYLPVLVQTGFLVVLYGQQTDGKKVLARKVTSVQSKATYVQDLSAPSHHNLMCIHVEGIPSCNCNKSVLMAGVAVVDLSTGRCMAGEFASRPSDPDLALDEVYRLLTVHTPVEVMLMGRADDLEANALIRRSELKHAGLYNQWRAYDERVEDPDYQNALLGKVYSERGTLSPAEYVGLERQPWALAALTAVLQFAYEQDERVISRIQPPEPLLKEGDMTVSYKTLKQLGIVGAAPEHDSLLKILNRCATAMGKRLFRDRLLNPVSDPEQLAERYRQRLGRMIALGSIKPAELAAVHASLRAVGALAAMDGAAQLHLQRLLESLERALDLQAAEQHGKSTAGDAAH
uniref:DNA mismatch repair protein MutS-like N-terminal domain-containing protein n=1 Tax=Tetradesmus obliquus TaxID=3088 RepID=A0A383W6G0_TETOB|eukprot:jgi/Sobl393_1/17209/SZX72266.1